MISNPPPYCRGDAVGRVLHESYVNWTEHHRECAQCGEQDWYIPGDMLELKEPPCDVKLATADGKERFFSRAPDLSVLCDKGRVYFRLWERSAMNQETVYTRKGMTHA